MNDNLYIIISFHLSVTFLNSFAISSVIDAMIRFTITRSRKWSLSSSLSPIKRPLKPSVHHISMVPRGLRGIIYYAENLAPLWQTMTKSPAWLSTISEFLWYFFSFLCSCKRINIQESWKC